MTLAVEVAPERAHAEMRDAGRLAGGHDAKPLGFAAAVNANATLGSDVGRVAPAGTRELQQFNWQVPDFVIVPGGNLGNVSAIGKGFQMFYDLGIITTLPRLVCAQAERADPLYRSYMKGLSGTRPPPCVPRRAVYPTIWRPSVSRRWRRNRHGGT